jgi:two-component system, cell cycle sensor histidine kinase and response regulator CckA
LGLSTLTKQNRQAFSLETSKYFAAKISIAYAILGGVWILFSDQAAALFFKDPLLIVRIGMYKGWLFVAVTSYLLFLMVRNSARWAQRQQAQMRHLLNSIPDMVWLKNVDGVYLFCNPSFECFFGQKESKIVGRNDYDFVSRGEADSFRQKDKEAIAANGAIKNQEWITLSAGGKRILSETIKTPLLDFNGNVLGVLGIGRDITALYEAQDALLQSQIMMKSIFEVSPIGIGLVFNRVLLQVNDYLCKITGYTREELIGKNARILYPSDEEYNFVGREKYRQIRDCGTGTIETRFMTKDGKILDILLSSTPVNPGDFSMGITFTALDITDRKRTEISLRESEEKFRLLVESAPDAIFAQTEGHFAYLNQSAVKLFGASSVDDLVGKTIMDRFHPDYHDSIREWARLLNEEKQAVTPLEEVCLRMDGSPVDVEMTAVPIQYNGLDGSLVFLRDISERIEREKAHRELEERLYQAQKLESVGALAGGVAHDFNNMLSVILGHAELAMEKVVPADAFYDNLMEMYKAAKRSSQVTQQLLAFARKQTIAPKNINLNDTVEGMLKMLRRLIGEGIDLAWLPQSALWPVKMDTGQIDQIIANLCVNARDAIKNIGKITIETSNVALNEADCAGNLGFLPGEYVMLSVSDDGAGMDKETLQRIFEPFFTTKEVGQGTGLGLATVYGIVKQNKGFIDVCSSPGQGATFRVFLPRHIGEIELAHREEAASVEKRGNETILIVEDEPAILKMAKIILDHQGYTTLTASSPSEAVRVVESFPAEIHLLMTDVIMPEMNGRDLAKLLLMYYPKLKSLYISGYTANIIAHHGVLDKGVHFIQKPFSQKDLAAKIREALSQ